MSLWRLGRMALTIILCLGCAPTRGGGPLLAEGELDLRSGDLIFLDLDCGELCQAMEQVTKEQLKVSGPHFSHVGMVESWRGGAVMILEAWPSGKPGGVIRTRLAEVLSRVKGGLDQSHGFRIGHLKPRYRSLGERAVQAARGFFGRPYDHRFRQNNGSYYCSELIYEAFKRANYGRPVFPLRPMFFGSPGTTAYAVWKKYYQQLGHPVPEGEPGLSPLGIYLYGQTHLFQGSI